MVFLDVFIGLVFIYFLYSLFVSIIVELFSTWIGMRARILRQGIDNFLNDRSPEKEDNVKGFRKWMQDVFLVEPTSFRYSNAGLFYKEPTIKYLAKVGENKWYSIRNTKPAYIEKSHFVTAIVSMLLRRSMGVNEWDKVKFSIQNNTLNLEPETIQMFKDWLDQSNDSYEKFKAFVGNSFEEINDRLVGWYKRKIGLFLFVVGLLLSFRMNVDTFEIVQTLADNPDKRIELVQLAIAKAQADSLATVKGLNKEKLDAEYNSTKTSIDKAGTLLGTGWKNMPEKGLINKVCYVWKESNPFTTKFWGFIITAFALSMGAKFWFDLLKRLVSLRGAGLKPDEHNTNKTKVKEAKILEDPGLKLNTSDPALIALSNNRQKWESQPGFVAANVKYSKSNVGFIELIFEEDRETDNMPQSIANPIDESAPPISITYKEGTKGSFINSDSIGIEGALLQSTTESWGTPAGLVLDKRSNRNVILTCGHVVRNDKTPFIDSAKSTVFLKEVINGKLKSTAIGQAKNLVLSSFCDAGVVSIDNAQKDKLKGLAKIDDVRDVTFMDEYVDSKGDLNTLVTIHTLRKDQNGKRIKVQGHILATGESYGFDDSPSSDIRFYDLFRIGNIDKDYTKGLTLAGDSGALITDQNGKHLGVLVGGIKVSGDHFSYGIKLKDIFDILQLEPPKNENQNNFFP